MKKKGVLYILMAAIVLLSTACGKTEDDNRQAISEPVVEKVEINPSAEEKMQSEKHHRHKGKRMKAMISADISIWKRIRI